MTWRIQSHSMPFISDNPISSCSRWRLNDEALKQPLVGIFNSSGVLVSSICGPEEGIPFHTLREQETYVIGLHNLGLFPGSYSVSIFLYGDEPEPILAAEESFGFDVCQAALGPGQVCYRGDHGIYRTASGMARLDN